MRIAVLGVGLIGGSIGLAARERVPGAEVVGWGPRRPTLEQAREIGAIQEIADTVADPAEVESELRYLAAVLTRK